MNTNLMHATGLWFTQYHACFTVETDLLKNSRAVFSFWRHFAHTNFITNYFNWFLTFDNATAIKEKTKFLLLGKRENIFI